MGRPVGLRRRAAYSFYPTKNLGALGDGGAMTFADPALASRARRLRNGGQTDKHHHAEFGVNSTRRSPGGRSTHPLVVSAW
jgi:dTDP-4-amino-4,6-dideoxygalactose transaminase